MLLSQNMINWCTFGNLEADLTASDMANITKLKIWTTNVQNGDITFIKIHRDVIGNCLKMEML